MKQAIERKQDIDKMKVQLIYKMYIMTFVFFYAIVVIGIPFSVWTLERKISGIILLTISISVMLIATVINQKYIQNLRLKYGVYMSIMLVFITIMQMVLNEKHIIAILPIYGVFTVITFISFKKSNVLVFICFTHLILLYYFFSNRFTVIEIATGFYVYVSGAMLLTGYVLFNAINLFRAYELSLYEKLISVEEANIELVALNEEYIAAEEELHAQYDEISDLHKKSVITMEQLDAIVASTEDGFIEYNPSNQSFDISAKAMSLLVLNDIFFEDGQMNITKRMSEEDAKSFMKAWLSIVEGSLSQAQVELAYDQGGEKLYFRFFFLKYSSRYESEEHIIIVVKDITTETLQEQYIYRLAYYDELTDLYSRSGFNERLKELIGISKTSFYVVLIDVDNFKYINDTFGYDVGDALLKLVADGLRVYSSELKFIARIGSDDFGFVIEDHHDPVRIIEDINRNKSSFDYEGTEFAINYSIGIASYTEGMTSNDLIKNAEIAMYLTKEKGKNGYQFYNQVHGDEVHKRLMMTNALEKAVARNEIYLVYQPKYRVNPNEIMGFEALVRWESKEYGFISPLEFIDLAEQTGYINLLGRFITEQACHFANRINAGPQSYIVSINISGRQLMEEGFHDDFMSILQKTDTDPSYIGIEVTETSFMTRIQEAEEVANLFRNSGIKIYLDDFGTGYSSLNYLMRLPIDVLKIDKSFIDEITTSDNAYKMLITIINLAKGFELEIVAEGVETKEQYDLLKENDCDMIQGYYLDKPLSLQEALKRVKDNG